MTDQELHSLLAQLPPAPWHARNNRVLAGDRTVAIVTAKNASLIARQLADLPALLDGRVEAETKAEEEGARLQARIDELEERVEDLKAELETARDEAASLRADLAEANADLDARIAGK